MQFYGQFSPPVDQFIFERYFPNLDIGGTFIECGAFDGLTECSCKFFEENMNWRGYNIEAAPHNYAKLVINRPNSNNFNIGLSDSNCVLQFKHAISPIVGADFGNGSFTHTKEHLDDLTTRGCRFEDSDVKVVTYKNFIEQNKINYVDLFVLDVEGHELSVIDGMIGSNVLPDVICIEFGHIGLGVVIDKLEPLGYVYDITSNANAFFVKKEKVEIFIFRRLNATLRCELTNKLFIDDSINLNNKISILYEDNNKLNKDIIQLLQENKSIIGENTYLKNHIVELTNLYYSVINTKWWSLRALFRKIIGIKSL